LFLGLLIAMTAMAALRPRHGLRDIARRGMGAAVAVAGVTHLADPTPFQQHIPDLVPGDLALVLVTGIVEIALGLALLVRGGHHRRIGVLLAAYLLAVFPANVYVAVASVEVDGQPGGALAWVRLPLQALFIAWTLWSAADAPARRDELVAHR
jgi:uncharacterized membrane protein